MAGHMADPSYCHKAYIATKLGFFHIHLSMGTLLGIRGDEGGDKTVQVGKGDFCHS